MIGMKLVSIGVELDLLMRSLVQAMLALERRPVEGVLKQGRRQNGRVIWSGATGTTGQQWC